MTSLFEILKKRTSEKREKSQAGRDNLLDFLKERNTELQERAEKKRLLAIAKKEVDK